MGKFVGIKRIHRAIVNLPKWREAVDSQGAMHLWPFLSAKRMGVSTKRETPFGEQDDKRFFDEYMHVRDTDEPYYDPLDQDFRIQSHYHSNVATSRKNTFVGRWRAAEFGTKGGQELWKFTPKYLDVIKDKMLSKGTATTKAPLFDVLAWLYHAREFPDDITLEKLVAQFRDEFHITDAEFSTILTRAPIDGIRDTDGDFFVDRRVPNELLMTALEEKENFDLTESLAAAAAGSRQPVELDDALTLIRSGRHQLILQGPPGTSKTYMARQLAGLLMGAPKADVEDAAKLSQFLRDRQYSMLSAANAAPAAIDGKGGTWDIVQFHPSYTYEDFVRGIAAKLPPGGGTPTFEVENRVFGIMADLSTHTKTPVILVIDEINRGDLSKILGELVYALEYRNEPVRTPYVYNGSALITVGNNFYLLATMNTADRSIALIDYAIRRRFEFIELVPERAVLEKYLAGKGLPSQDRVLELFDAISGLFEDKRDFAVGHTYYMGKDTGEIAHNVVFQVLPLLAEYQKEGILDEHANIQLTGWPGQSALRTGHPHPFALAQQLKDWLEGGGSQIAAAGATPGTDEAAPATNGEQDGTKAKKKKS